MFTISTVLSMADSIVPPQNLSHILSQPSALAPIVSSRPKPDLIPGIPDGVLSLIAPVVAYWAYSTFFHLIDVYHLAEQYRIHPSEEELARNKASLSEVIQDVVLQHIVQTIVGYGVYKLDPPPTTGHELHQMWYLKNFVFPAFVPNSVVWFSYMYLWSALRIVIAFVIIDSWQYWLHRLMHVNKNLYRRFHSRHHRLYVPYAYGALYNDPVEGFLLDTLGTGIASTVTGMSPREAIILYTFATLKTVDDHCGYKLPFDIFQIVFPNNSVYHDIHHQAWGIKHNFSQPFFTYWDKFNKTEYQFVAQYKEKQARITLEKYREFLANRKSKKMSPSSSGEEVIITPEKDELKKDQ